MDLSIKDIIKLFDKFENSSISELRFSNTDVEFVLKRDQREETFNKDVDDMRNLVVQEESLPLRMAEPPMIGRGTKGDDSVSSSEEILSSSQQLVTVRSPIVGTFYRAPAPDAPPFVREGGKVKKGETVGIIEAMKVMNKLEAEFDMEIVHIHVQNSAMVEHGTVLFEVKQL